jgi:hypothetical protein
MDGQLPGVFKNYGMKYDERILPSVRRHLVVDCATLVYGSPLSH